MLPNLQPPNSVPFHRKRSHCLVGLHFPSENGAIGEDDTSLQPNEKQPRSETNGLLVNNVVIPSDEPTCVHKPSPENRSSDVAKMETEDSFINSSKSGVVEDVDDSDEDKSDMPSDLLPNDVTRLVFKVPLHQLLTCPRENFLNENPWVKANSSDKALVVWQPSQVVNRGVSSHSTRQREQSTCSSLQSVSSSSGRSADSYSMQTDDDGDSGMDDADELL